MTPAGFLAHLLAAHLAVPEPITLKIDPGPVGFDGYSARYDATISRQHERGGAWLIRYDAKALAASRPSRWQFVLAHEVCHAIYEYDTNWPSLTDKERARRHKITNACARGAIRAHEELCR